MGASPWPHPPLRTCQTVIFVCGAMLYLHLCTLKLVSFPARLTPTGSRLGPPRKWRRGLKIWTPSFLVNWDPFEAKTAKKLTLAQKSYGSCLSDIPYHTIASLTRYISESNFCVSVTVYRTERFTFMLSPTTLDNVCVKGIVEFCCRGRYTK